jgi:hypothetical protein
MHHRAAAALLIVLSMLAACGPEEEAAQSPSEPSSATDAPGTAEPGTVAPGTAEPAASGPAATDAGAASPPPEAAGTRAVEVLVDGLNVRRAPGLAGELVGRLPIGTQAIVSAGPESADDYGWVHAAGLGLIYPSGCGPTGPPPPDGVPILSCPVWSGWAAEADLDGTPWLGQSDVNCPEPPTELRQVAELQWMVPFHCFGRTELTVRAFLPAQPQAATPCEPGATPTPDWLASPCETVELWADAGYGLFLPVRVHPNLGSCGFDWPSDPGCPLQPLAGTFVQVTGHFDDPAAAECTTDDAATIPASVVLECRRQFVVTSFQPES